MYEMKDLFKRDPKTGGSKGLVFIGDKILVYRRDGNTNNFPHCIDLPGGGPESNETPFENFKREVKEEFSLDINPEHVVYFNVYPSSIESGKVTYFPVVKLPESESKNIKLGNEGLEYLLMSTEEFLGLKDLAWPHMKERVVDYLDSES